MIVGLEQGEKLMVEIEEKEIKNVERFKSLGGIFAGGGDSLEIW